MWGRWGRFVISASLKLTIPESPRDIFEAWAILEGFLTFGKNLIWVQSQERKRRREIGKRRERSEKERG
jgi:hypothetical protein